jgi:lipopolysaccharide transport system permease protein
MSISSHAPRSELDRIGSGSASAPGEHVTVLEAGRTDRDYWRDLWRHRELFLILAWRDLATRYKQTVIGVAWALIRPLFTVAIFTVVFGRIARLPSDGAAPYALMVFAGMVPWTLISTILGDAASSLVNSANLVGKVYFPRLIMPSAKIVVSLADAGIALVLLFGMMLWFGFVPDWRIVFLPLFVLLAILASLGPALWLAAMNLKYRDLQFVIPFLIQLGVYVSPVGFSTAAIPQEWRLLYSLNPVVAVIDGFRWSLLRGEAELYLPGLLCGMSVIAVMMWIGIRSFRKAERSFADLI